MLKSELEKKEIKAKLYRDSYVRLLIMSNKYYITIYHVQLSKREIQNLKNTMEGFHPQKFINEIISAHNTSKSIKEAYVSKNSYIESLRKNSITTFLENMKNKTVKEISTHYVKKVDEFSKATQLYCDKKSKEK